MPANLSREYKRAESDFRQARDAKERLAHLREMLRTIPKHKGTEPLLELARRHPERELDNGVRSPELTVECRTTSSRSLV